LKKVNVIFDAIGKGLSVPSEEIIAFMNVGDSFVSV
jgi:hypothetical protein